MNMSSNLKVSMDLKPLNRKFYSCETVSLAQKLLGKLLARHLEETILIGRIVETEAYRGLDDPASHAYRGRTTRNEVMFQAPGLAYVYFSYGNHYCLNVVGERVGIPGAVLIRALEPLIGIDIMMKNRGVKDIYKLANGPGKLTKALLIDRRHNGLDLTLGRELFISEPNFKEDFRIMSSKRIGVRVGLDKMWRFYIEGSLFVSR